MAFPVSLGSAVVGLHTAPIPRADKSAVFRDLFEASQRGLRRASTTVRVSDLVATSGVQRRPWLANKRADSARVIETGVTARDLLLWVVSDQRFGITFSKRRRSRACIDHDWDEAPISKEHAHGYHHA